MSPEFSDRLLMGYSKRQQYVCLVNVCRDLNINYRFAGKMLPVQWSQESEFKRRESNLLE
jgi:hypothetical protein